MFVIFDDAFDFNGDGKLDAVESAIGYHLLFDDPQEEQSQDYDEEEEFLDDLEMIEEDW